MHNKFKLIEVKSEGSKEYFIEGHVSTQDPDFVDDIVDDQGQKATFRDLNNYDITMDEDHDEWRNPDTGEVYDGKLNKLPIARVVESRLDDIGTWARVHLNKHHPNFDKYILPSIQKGFLHSFSIAYKVLKSFDKVIDDVKYRVIQDLKIANIALTGNPVNKNATFNLALKSFSKMVNEKTVEGLTAEIAELKSLHKEELEKVQAELKAKGEKYKAELSEKEKELLAKKAKDDESKKKDKAEMKSISDKKDKEILELKSSFESSKSEIAELKSKVEEYESQPMLK
ncbi:MAG TPA: hypothetical protein DCL21_03700, partial [Alphaproteobacteria bacterium]|nr:hypothetical protein [Alphaproteobacteria bacterium]